MFAFADWRPTRDLPHLDGLCTVLCEGLGGGLWVPIQFGMRPVVTIRGLLAKRSRREEGPELFEWNSLEPAGGGVYVSRGEGRTRIVLPDTKQRRVALELYARATVRAWRAGALTFTEDHTNARARMTTECAVIAVLGTHMAGSAAWMSTGHVWWVAGWGVFGLVASLVGMHGQLRIALDRRCATRVAYEPAGFRAQFDDTTTRFIPWDQIERAYTLLSRAEVHLRGGDRVRMLVSRRARIVLREQLRAVRDPSHKPSRDPNREALVRCGWYCLAAAVVLGALRVWLGRLGLGPVTEIWRAAVWIPAFVIGLSAVILWGVSVHAYGLRFWRSRAWRRAMGGLLGKGERS